MSKKKKPAVYRPNPTIATKAASWWRGIGRGLATYFVVAIPLAIIFRDNFSDWMAWVALGCGILAGLSVLTEWRAACPYCGNQLTFDLEPKELKCNNCEHRVQIDTANKLLIPIDMLPMPIQPTSQPGRQGSGWGKAVAAGLAGAALGALASEAAAEEMPQEAQGDVDADIDIDIA